MLKQQTGDQSTIHARLAHVGIYAHDKPLLERFYTTVLGLMVTDSGRPDTSGFNPINQISFMVDSLADLRVVHRRALDHGATEMRVTSHGNAWSCYFKDPEGNTVEAYLDTPFHVPQPHGEPLDLDKTDAEIMRETEASCRADPGFMMMDEFQKSLASRLAH